MGPVAEPVVRGSKPDQIVAAAQALFLSEGLASTSMDALARRAGVSKATVYAHFESKEALFVEAMTRICEASGPALPEQPLLDPVEPVLLAAAASIVERVFSEEGVVLLRTAISDTRQVPELGQLYWNSGPAVMDAWLQELLARLLASDDRWRFADAESARQAFIGSLLGAELLPVLLDVQPAPDAAWREQRCEQAVAEFVRQWRRA